MLITLHKWAVVALTAYGLAVVLFTLLTTEYLWPLERYSKYVHATLHQLCNFVITESMTNSRPLFITQ